MSGGVKKKNKAWKVIKDRMGVTQGVGVLKTASVTRTSLCLNSGSTVRTHQSLFGDSSVTETAEEKVNCGDKRGD